MKGHRFAKFFRKCKLGERENFLEPTSHIPPWHYNFSFWSSKFWSPHEGDLLELFLIEEKIVGPSNLWKIVVDYQVSTLSRAQMLGSIPQYLLILLIPCLLAHYLRSIRLEWSPKVPLSRRWSIQSFTVSPFPGFHPRFPVMFSTTSLHNF